jgi:hypothetical protein
MKGWVKGMIKAEKSGEKIIRCSKVKCWYHNHEAGIFKHIWKENGGKGFCYKCGSPLEETQKTIYRCYGCGNECNVKLQYCMWCGESGNSK